MASGEQFIYFINYLHIENFYLNIINDITIYY